MTTYDERLDRLEAERDEARAIGKARRDYLNQLMRHPDPRDPDHPHQDEEDEIDRRPSVTINLLLDPATGWNYAVCINGEALPLEDPEDFSTAQAALGAALYQVEAACVEGIL